MIPRDFITEWRDQAPWASDRQVEQDLVISRALVELYSDPTIAKALAFHSGAALYKLHVQPAVRYSEDIDLVQTQPEAIGPALNAIRARLDSWLGKPHWKQSEARVTLAHHAWPRLWPVMTPPAITWARLGGSARYRAAW